MSRSARELLAGAVAGGLAIGLGYVVGAGQPEAPRQAQPPTKTATSDRGTDESAIRVLAKDFATAFNKGDARAVAAQWSETGECSDADGTLIRGRANIEQAFGEFFKANPKARIEVLVESIRFPAPDLAVEEGLLRQMSTVKDLPATTLYSATHVRTGGKWQTAASREWGAGQDRLEDLEWLVGQWRANAKDHEVTLTITRDENKSSLMGRFATKADGKVVSTGTMRIGLDPETGQLRSWHFDEDGGHGQALWLRDGNRWVLDCVGVTGKGAETASVNLLGRLNNDEITWQSIDRVLGVQELPDTTPIRLTRVQAAK